MTIHVEWLLDLNSCLNSAASHPANSLWDYCGLVGSHYPAFPAIERMEYKERYRQHAKHPILKD